MPMIDRQKGENQYSSAKRYFKNDLSFDTFCNLNNRLVEIVKEAVDPNEPMPNWKRLAYCLMAIELYGLDVIDEEFLDNFLKCVCFEYWLYEKYGIREAASFTCEVRF